ncbi:uncharacterized protein LOC132942000 isoform X2 [Metopolophium dirhodum]|uniref:uncharacterized protein LOC132942000 isoform X2 n=1 Tax=Metopolophium dirhodum TaxID=44670 RepID=UPI00298FC3AF|nr:uncharacterized protein LOC132942000 isoform X2 [Metopolophium dirhodum]
MSSPSSVISANQATAVRLVDLPGTCDDSGKMSYILIVTNTFNLEDITELTTDEYPSLFGDEDIFYFKIVISDYISYLRYEQVCIIRAYDIAILWYTKKEFCKYFVDYLRPTMLNCH